MPDGLTGLAPSGRSIKARAAALPINQLNAMPGSTQPKLDQPTDGLSGLVPKSRQHWQNLKAEQQAQGPDNWGKYKAAQVRPGQTWQQFKYAQGGGIAPQTPPPPPGSPNGDAPHRDSSRTVFSNAAEAAAAGQTVLSGPSRFDVLWSKIDPQFRPANWREFL